MRKAERVKKCFVPRCFSTSETKIMLTVPLQRDRRKRWFEAVGINRLVSTPLYCCEDHFDLQKDAENWTYFKTIGSSIVLRPNVVPHLATPKKNRPSQLSDSSKKRKIQALSSLESSTSPVESPALVESLLVTPVQDTKARRRKQIIFTTPDPDEQLVAVDVEQVDLTTGTANLTQPLSESMEVGEPASNVDETGNDHSIPVELAELTTAGTSGNYNAQPSTSSRPDDTPSTSPSKAMDDLPSCSTFVPMTSAESLEELLSADVTEPSRAISLVTRDPRFYLGIPKAEFEVIKMASDLSKCSARDIMITIKKLRLNDSNKRLGYDFNLSTGYVSKIFVKTIQSLSVLFQQLIFWPPQVAIKKLMPIPFRHRLGDVQSIIDCFEIQIEKPSKPKNQALTWSEYKKCNTVKVLISCTPYGFINFLSKSYGGRISDRTIFLNSGYMDVVPSGCAVLADRGFKQIEGDLLKKNVTLLRPASVKASMKPTKAEVRESKRIAATRIHVERVISRIREFRFLDIHSRIDLKLVRLVDHCAIVAAAIINLQEPILKL